MDAKNGHKNNEKQLFHGTDADSVPHVNHNGFNRSYAGKNGKEARDPAAPNGVSVMRTQTGEAQCGLIALCSLMVCWWPCCSQSFSVGLIIFHRRRTDWPSGVEE